MDEIRLGSRVTDVVSGFTGTVVAMTTYLYSSPRAQVAPDTVCVEGRPAEWTWFDQGQLRIGGPAKSTGLIR